MEKFKIEYYRRIASIRQFESNLLLRFNHGERRGTTHTCIGQEAIALAALAPLRDEDLVFSNHRSHGHFLAYGGEMSSLLCEIFGHQAGVCQG